MSTVSFSKVTSATVGDFTSGQNFDAGVEGYFYHEMRDDIRKLVLEQPDTPRIHVSTQKILEYVRKKPQFEDVTAIEELEEGIEETLFSIWYFKEFQSIMSDTLDEWKAAGNELKSTNPFDRTDAHPVPHNTVVVFDDTLCTVSIGQDLSGMIGEVVAIEGLVRHISPPRGRVRTALFRCDCGEGVMHPVEGRFTRPNIRDAGTCPTCGQSGNWKYEIDGSDVVSYQQIRVQEPPEGSTVERPREVDIDVVGEDLMDKCSVGDRVTVIGTVRAEPAKNNNLVETWLDGLTVCKTENKFDEEDISEEDHELIETIAARDDIYDLIVDSVAPQIYGYDDVKLGLVCSLVGGQTRWTPDGARNRGESHTFLIGDPGTAKSALANYVADISPRSVKAVGQGASAAGLTATAEQIEFAGEQQWVLSGGALVMADGGVAVIDELDKAHDGDKTAMHEAMEDGVVTIQKAAEGTLNARTTVIATANPKNGVWDPWKPLSDQFDIESSLLSRFDLVFTFTDKVDEERDRKIGLTQLEHRYDSTVAYEPNTNNPIEFDGNHIPKPLFRKYVAVARKIAPVMSKEVIDVLNDFYVALRISSDDEGAIPVTARELPALARLAEAVARIQLSEKITMEHAQITMDLVMGSLEDVGIDPETGELDAYIKETGQPKSQHKRYQQVRETVEVLGDGQPVSRETALAFLKDEHNIDRSQAMTILKRLLKKGDLYQVDDEKIALA